MSDSGKKRAERILRRATGLFSEAEDPGFYTETWAGLTVALSVEDTGKMKLMIIKPQEQAATGEMIAPTDATITKLNPVFEVEWQAGEPAVVSVWEGGGWERAFTASN
jgi:hypothetical protein